MWRHIESQRCRAEKRAPPVGRKLLTASVSPHLRSDRADFAQQTGFAMLQQRSGCKDGKTEGCTAHPVLQAAWEQSRV